jgi:hypothetical protein
VVSLESSAGVKQREFAETVTGTKPAGTMAGSTLSVQKTSGCVPIACKKITINVSRITRGADSDDSEKSLNRSWIRKWTTSRLDNLLHFLLA